MTALRLSILHFVIKETQKEIDHEQFFTRKLFNSFNLGLQNLYAPMAYISSDFLSLRHMALDKYPETYGLRFKSFKEFFGSPSRD